MRGIYTFKQDGKIVGTSENLITTAGKKVLLDFLAGYTSRIGGSIAVGIGTTAAALTDNSLAYQVLRIPVTLVSADYLNSGVVFKGTIPAGYEMTIQEAGVFTSSDPQGTSQLLLDFNQSTDVWSSGTYTTANSRMGSMLTVSAAASATNTSTLSNLFLDLSQYAAGDRFSLAYRASNGFVSSFSVRLKTDASNYYSFTVNAPASGAYTITNFDKSAAVATGTPNWNNITSVDVVVTATSGGTGTIGLDALRVENRTNLPEDDVLFSRSVLATPVVKVLETPLDVEYTVTV